MRELILQYFHKVRHSRKKHEVHHYGKESGYNVEHCECGKHSCDRELITVPAEKNIISIKLNERCPYGGWHLESGEIIKHNISFFKKVKIWYKVCITNKKKGGN